MITQSIKSKDGTTIHRYQWLIPESRAHLMLVHGYAEHGERYDHFAKYLNDQRISFTAYDQRGHGRSDGLKAYIDKFDDYVDDLEEMITELTTETPIFLMGHSMGGLVCVHYVLNKDISQIKGFISSSAALEIDKNLSPLLQFFAPIIGKIFPKLPTEKLDITYLTRTPEVLEAYMNDPLIYLKGTRARTGAEMLKAIRTGSARFKEINLPLFVLHGEADRLTMPGGSQKLYNDAKSTDKTLKIYPGLYHELINEPEKIEVMKDIKDWILKRIH